MKIAYIYPETIPSNLARTISVVNTAFSLSDLVDTTLFVSKIDGNIFKKYNIENKNLKIVELKKEFLGIKSNKIFNYSLLKKIKKENFDFIYVRHLKVAYFLIQKGFNVIFECHEIFYKTNPKTKELENFIYKNTKGLIFTADTLKEEFNKNFSIKNIAQTTIRNGCGFRLNYIKKDFSSIEDMYYIGNFYPWKGIDFLIDAIKETKLKLKIIGDGDRKEDLQKYTLKNNIKNVEFLGYKDHKEIQKILSTTKLTVIPNIPTNFSNFSAPIKLYEYLMSSNIVLASDTPVIKEILKDKQNGFLFKSGDKDSFLKKLNFIRSQDNKTLQTIAKNAFLSSQEFTWDNRAKQIVSFIKSIK